MTNILPNLLQQEISGDPVEVILGGRKYPLTFGMAAAIVYKRETARIERSRPRDPDPDPKCLCGAARSQHSGPDLIIVGEDKRLRCFRFRLYDPIQGDSLYSQQSWHRIDLDVDPERFLVCLYSGLHQPKKGGDGNEWEAPMTLAELATKIPLGPGARDLATLMILALVQSQPRPPKEPSPNAEAPAVASEPAQTEMQKISTGSGQEPGAVSD